jgi:NADPH:quinone reductase-like Zn-dependent oxidoreductase
MIVDASAGFGGESKFHVKALNNHKWEYIFMGTATKEIKDMISELSPTSKLMCSTKSSTIATRVHIYDVYANWDNDTENCKRDLCHLINLLEKRVIKPKILDRMPLSKVAKAHEILNTKRLQGHLVCEPWMKSMQRAVYL